jgi:hypothetical protein
MDAAQSYFFSSRETNLLEDIFIEDSEMFNLSLSALHRGFQRGQRFETTV